MNKRFSELQVDFNLIFQTLISNTNDYIYVWDFHSGDYMVSSNFTEDFGIAREGEDFLSVWHSFIHTRDLERVKDKIDEAIMSHKSSVKMEYQAVNSHGDYIWLSDKATINYSEDSEYPSLIIGIMHNLLFDGQIDTTTGLLMHNKCKENFELMQRNKMQSCGSLLLLGIDEFAAINTLYSHTFGDMVLRTTVQDLLNFLPEEVSMYRYDGDQLLIIAEKKSKAEMKELYDTIKAYTSNSREIHGQSYRFTISAGIAEYPSDGITWEELEKAVSVALKKAKEMGKNYCVEFTDVMLKERVYEQSLGHLLANSIENDFSGFKVVFQPVCFAQNLKVKGAEILLRYQLEDGTVISPDKFIPFLEQSQLIIPVGMWVMEKAMQACKRWTSYHEDFVMNINVSFIQLRDTSFCDKVQALLEKYDLDVSHITIELTESYFITDASNINISMRLIKELHLQIAMDDFGTGYSSLARLAQFNVDVVKIDRSFVQSVNRSKYNRDFVDAVVRLCHNVGMRVCVEGVETKEEQESICVLNVDYIQGFYVSQPVEEQLFFSKFIINPDANQELVVVPNVQLRKEQLVGDKDVLSAMMEATPLALNLWNEEMEIITCNAETLSLFSVESVEILREKFYQLSPTKQPDGQLSSARIRQILSLALAGETIRTYWEHCGLDGEVIPAEVTVVRIPYMGQYIVVSYTRDMREQRRMERQIETFNNQLKALLDATPLCLNLWNKQYDNIMCNKAAVELFDLRDEQEYLDRFFELSPEYQPDGRLSSEKATMYIEEAFRTGKAQFEWMHKKINGERIAAEITLVKVIGLDEGGELVAGFTRDIRAQLKAENLQKTVNTRIQAVIDSAPLACILWTSDLKVIDCNRVAVQMLGAESKNDIINGFEQFFPLKQPDGKDSVTKKDKKFAEVLEKNSIIFEWVYINTRKEQIFCEVSLVKVSLEKEDIIIAYSRDLRELYQTQELNERLSKMAYFDLLTGITSRARFSETMESSFEAALPSDGFALALFDIDFFKAINDTYGHEAGDMVLKKVSQLVKEILPDNAIFGRFGGDEFIIQMENTNISDLNTLLNKIVKSVSELNFTYGGSTFSTAISMGASFKSNKDKKCQQLINRTDKALYRAKAKGRNCSVIL